MAKTTAPVSLVKHDRQPASRRGSHTHTHGSTNTYKLTQAQRDTVRHSGSYSQLGRRGRERDEGGTEIEEKDEEDVRGGQMEREVGRKQRESRGSVKMHGHTGGW